MDVTWLQELMADWHPPVAVSIGCAAVLVLYVAGFSRVRRTRPDFPAWRAFSFVTGVLVLWLALASPLAELADTLLTAHMVEHLLLMAAVPPLTLAGWPTVPLLRGTPAFVRRWTMVPALRSPLLRRLSHLVARPVVAWMAMNITLLFWHIPRFYDLALENEAVHDLEHVCFLATSLLFWWVLLRPWPSHTPSLRWGALLYLVTADAVNTTLSALLAFAGRPVYSYYVTHENGLGLSPVMDQTLGASVMWVFGSVAFLLPAMILLARLLRSRHAA